MSTRQAYFGLLLRQETLVSVSLDGKVTSQQPLTLGELEVCGFRLSFPESDMEYQIRVGDEIPDDEAHTFGDSAEWRQMPYFESARGRVVVYLLSRPTAGSPTWRNRAQLLVNVVPTKLGEERYEAMFEDLRSVSVGLVFDLLSKSRLNLGLNGVGSITSRPASAELMVLERLWYSISSPLQQIAVQPMAGLRLTQETRLCWGNERLVRTGLRQLAMAGIDPRKGDVPRPFYATRERVYETFDISEHRTIAGFLAFLCERIVDCKARAVEHVRAIENERPFRDIEQNDGANLYRDIDYPKTDRLQRAVVRSEKLLERLRSAKSLGFLRHVRPALGEPQGPIFKNVPSYRRFRDEMLRYLGTSLAILDEGLAERGKSTSRMYEQWIFLQLVAAFRASGLSPMSQEGLLTRTRRHRFTIDLERGARVSFSCPDGSSVSVRYEPWIHPSNLALSLQETVYRGRSGENSWSPDVLIEVLRPGDRKGIPSVDYAVVVDAKYSRQINARQMDGVRKYNEIRRTEDNRPVVKQVWLAYPADSGITPWDEAVEWTRTGPNRPRDENVNGTLGVRPTVGERVDNIDSAVNDTLLEFTKGILTYLNLINSEKSERRI